VSKKYKVQVPKKHYFEGYDDLNRFISYFYQIDLVRELRPTSILEIGVGNKTVANYLKHHGFKVDTCDFDKDLEPDHVADIRDLPFEDGSYDAVMACEILEHIPWEDVEKALRELHRVTRKHVVISVPSARASFEIIFVNRGFPLVGRMIKRPINHLHIKNPLSSKDKQFSGEHYWEVGTKSYPLKRIRTVLKRYFRISKEIKPVLDSDHYFFTLEKK